MAAPLTISTNSLKRNRKSVPSVAASEKMPALTSKASAPTFTEFLKADKAPANIARAAPPNFNIPGSALSHPQIAEAMERIHTNIRRSPNVWMHDSDMIIKGVLRSAMPVFDLGVDLAWRQHNYRLPCSSKSTPGKQRPPLEKLIPQLLRDWELCLRVNSAWKNWIARMPNTNYRKKKTFTTIRVSYYVVRLLVCAYDQPKLKSALRSKFSEIPMEQLETHWEVCFFMTEKLDDDEQALQGILKDEKDWEPEDEVNANINKDEWEFAMEELSEACRKKATKHG